MKRLIQILIPIFFCLSCKQKTYYVGSLLRKAVTVKDGSYFIYKDSVTGIEDSFWVFGYLNKVTEYGGDDSKIQEFIKFNMRNSTGRRFDFSVHARVDGNKEWISAYFNDSAYQSNFIPLTDPQATHVDINAAFVGKRDTLTIFSKDYYKVYIYTHVDSSSRYIKSSYSACDGLIKVEAKNGGYHRVYELVKSYIAK